MNYDVIIIGGGPAGLMASVAAAEGGASVLLVDKGEKLGRKLAISGGGRCNVTNRMPLDELIKHLPGNGKFLYSALSSFNNEDIIAFFEGLGIPLKEEDHGRMFPVTDSAKSVVGALLNKIKRLNVEIKVNAPVAEVLYDDERVQGIRLKSGETVHAKSVIVAVGGKSVPNTGSTGDGYAWAKKAGHTITELYPTEVPLTSSEPFIKQKTLQGLSLSDVALTAFTPKKKAIKTHRWDMLFTHFGVSGPAALRLSQYVVKALKKYNADYITVTLDVLPDDGENNVFDRLMATAKKQPDKAIRNAWKSFAPERYLLFLLEHIDLDVKTTYHQLPKDKVRAFAQMLKAFPIKIDGTLSIEKAFITGGGVSLKEIHPKALASKKMDGLYFCGEILDIHGYTGGYNITSAFVTGHAAGTDAAASAKMTE
ncbi:NAD(P)/FAD-dependent oxidoreductase [Lentibacillus saliphilus]|uniref:NAD(P)/FAD-dependent oxidoreductase n=1 Tax=Lentibacillus saliphilus TaxID=2737028 RepID=UPI001C30F033|nr:NAD(P)/FAD-dependent oxidoreductase [Lentibacillus saliphilus]